MRALTFQNKFLLVCHAYLLTTIFSCTTNTEIQPPNTNEVEVSSRETISQDEDEISYGSFTEQQLYQTIVSELSAQRGDFDDAGDNYLDLAIETKDLAVIQRAIQFASVNDDVNALMQLGLLWSEVEPMNTRPHLMLSFQFLENGNYPQALSHMASVLDLGGEFDFTALTTRTGTLETIERAQLISEVRQLVNEFQSEESLRITLVQLLAQNRELEKAQSEVRLILEEFGPSPRVILLYGQILQNMDDQDGAIRTLKSGLREFEQDRSLRLNLARLLIQNDQLKDAYDQFEFAIDGDPEDWESLYSMSLLDMELERYDRAIPILEKLISVDQRFDESQYYLGLIYERITQFGKSIEHYRMVRVGTTNYLAAQQQATRHSISVGELNEAHSWLIKQSNGQPRLEILFTTVESNLLIQAGYNQEAKSLLDSALNRFPNEAELLFARVLWFDSQGDREGSERDLRQIVRMQPEDARALNHLGYMLADQTNRFEEALDLIERAISIVPDDPAIIDSLAWAQYKLGRYEEALVNLRRAFAVFPDHEVASHLGEVLWKLGEHKEATQVWEDALEKRPDSQLIKEVIERFTAE
tara:strand:- start:648 stop:2405 length:1758 start_codon:yes stop_codon:yes gene_type:complete